MAEKLHSDSLGGEYLRLRRPVASGVGAAQAAVVYPSFAEAWTCGLTMRCNGDIALLLQSARLVAVVTELGSLRHVAHMRVSTLILTAVALLMTGCVATELRVTNRTGKGIHIYSGHTKRVTTISAGATATVPHTSGRVILITQRDEVWEYDDVQSLVDEAAQSCKRVSLRVDIEPDGSIVLPFGKKLTPTRRLR